MADRAEMAFLKNALGVNTTTNPQEQTALQDLIFSRLLTGNWQINSSGVVSFLFAGNFADGTVLAPAITWTNDLLSGRYRIGANNYGESIASTKVFDWNASRLSLALNLIFTTDNTNDIGASGATRPRDFFLGRNAAIGGTLNLTGAATFQSTAAFTGAVTLTGGLNTPLASAQGGTGSAFFAIAGPSALRTYTLPDANTTVLTTNALVGVAQGGTGLGSGTSGGVPAYTGSTTITSSGALTQNGVVVGGGAGAVPTSTSAGTTGSVLAGNTGSAPTFQTGGGIGLSSILLKANSGTDTNAGATNVDTVAISGLTALDTVIVYATFESVTQATAGVLLYSSTDAVSLVNLDNAAGVAAGQVWGSTGRLTMRQGSTTLGVGTSFSNGSFTTNVGQGAIFTLVTAWTGSWTLALRHTGVTAGGTFKWRWAVYRQVGQ